MRAEEDGAAAGSKVEAAAIEIRTGGAGGAPNNNAIRTGGTDAANIDRREVVVILRSIENIGVDEGTFFTRTAIGDIVEVAVGGKAKSGGGVELEDMYT